MVRNIRFFAGTASLTEPTIGYESLERKTFSDAIEYHSAVTDKWNDDSVVTTTAENVTIQQLMGSFEIRYSTSGHDSAPIYEPEYLGIHFGDSSDDVLQALGITEAGTRYLKSAGVNFLDIGILHSVLGVKIEEKKSHSSISVWCDWANTARWGQVFMYFDENNSLDRFHISIT